MNTFRARTCATWHDTRGIVLPLTLFIVVLLAGLVIALLSVGGMESQISANLLRGTQAFDLADAGAERAIAQFVGQPALVGNATCSPTCGAATTLFAAQALGTFGTYTVTSQPVGPNTVLVQSTGQSAVGGVTQKVQVVVTVPVQNPFAVEGDDIQLTGNTLKVNGTAGSVYGETTVNIAGNNAFVQQTATSTGPTCTNCTNTKNVGNVAGSGSGKPAQVLPTADAMTYKPNADYLLQDDGTILVQTTALAGQGVAAGTVITCGTGSSGCTTGPFAGWNMGNAPGDWHYTANSNPPNGMYYASQELSVDGNVGSGGTPWKATLLSGAGTSNPNNTGEWEINGNNVNIVPYYQNLFGVGGAFVISGNNVNLTGTMIATTKSRGFSQPMDNGGPVPSVQLTGNNVTINGQLLSDGQVVMSGNNFTLNYNPAGGGGQFGAPQIMSWTRLAQ